MAATTGEAGIMKAMRALLRVGLLLASAAAAAGDALPSLPVERDARFLGVDTCGSSECHGSQEPWRNATVSMKERLVWQAHDPHAKAYEHLAGEQGQAIARKFGVADATTAPECLVCHSTFVPAAQRGPKFTLSAGVGCESCHGPGSQFLKAHVQPTSRHADSVAAGMYPTELAAPRAALCLSCHQGDARRGISHALYGAGHPRLRFELDTYGAAQPSHYLADADYRRRKPLASHLELWAAGQLRAARLLLDQVARAHDKGLFPELANYDCQACHRPIGTDADYRPRPGVGPGGLSVNDAPLLALRALASVVAPAEVDGLRADTHALQTALFDRERRAATVARLGARLDTLTRAWEARGRQDGDTAAVLGALLALARGEAALGYGAAETIAMASATLVAAGFEQQTLAADKYARANQALDGIYAAVEDERHYRAKNFVAALAGLATALGNQ